MKKNYDLALKLVQEIKHNNEAKRRIFEAQIYYRMKEFQKAYDIYRDVLDAGSTNHVKECEENILAIIVSAQLENPGTLKTRGEDQLPSQDDIIDQIVSINLKDPQTYDLFTKSKVKRKRRKTTRSPKECDPNVVLDPERWLPRRDRKGANYKQKKRRQRPNKKR